MIRRLLVANRGEIARRVFASCRLVGIETVAVYSDADADSPHVAEADYAVHLPGNAPTATYLRGDLMIGAARKTGADAIHPGYGFLSENADFAALVTDNGLTWVGPPAKVIATMGSKIEAKTLLADAGIPMLPTWFDADRVSEFPVLVKASAGGGGRGMRIVHDRASLPEAISSARREAALAFGDGTVFMERYVESARHIEVQIFADAQGTVVPFGERECSIQRRYQKVIEESPSPVVTPQLREQLCAAAVAAARAVGYVGAGTVEFLVDAVGGGFYFLEMNTRLQVEHGVTELITGFDLVQLQLAVAEGNPLPLNAPPPMRGHAIEVRLCAEDPAANWLPSTGTLHRFHIPQVAGEFKPLQAPGLRLDSGVRDGSVVGVHYDSMLAKLMAWAPTRADAGRLLSGALARAEIHGVTTNRDLLVRTLRHPSFRAGDIDTAFLQQHPEVFAPLLSSVDAVRVSCLAAALAGAAARHADASVLGSLPSGWRNVPSRSQTTVYDGPAGPVEVGYRLDRAGDLVNWWVRAVDPDDPDLGGLGQPPATDDHPPAQVVSAEADAVALDVNGIRLMFTVRRIGEVSYVDSPEGSVALQELPRFPLPSAQLAEGSLVAPLPGHVSRVMVVPGQRVRPGELLMTLEAMKLEHPVYAPSAGYVSALPVGPGSQVETGAVLAVLSPE
ncbi:acetyl/propionyl-CoA carboxylase subuit alpha [Asanoa ishikariensis]|uniref:Propionyl-CoA carboxylase alpha chain n=1 Tax=Asanoa ishikariensis TaxID=137265 RepID=A0A1H3UVL4_9ACTN|nr:biotin carboxylase N-terminal domain-containing protein [Asanoa ishikariensis]GIF65160.1 acetyl/propionyl-CoA carboxylase subuit alpha [Asanoa ishikariensis]SDZ66454.1 propionyl-CoA carboxylase alpha chain [Asanoa ishikariensis]